MFRKNSSLNILIVVFFVALFFTGFFLENYGTSNEIPFSEQNENIENSYIDPKEEKPKRIIPKKIQINIAATGDVMFHLSQIRGAYNPEDKTYNFEPTFERIKEYIEDVDLALCNFETVTAGPEFGYKGYPTFNTPKESILALKNTGFDLLSTANNHSLDKGKKGIVNTIDNIYEYGLQNIGTYKEKPSNRVIIKDIKGIKLAFMSYTYGCNGLESLLTEEELSYMVNIIDEEKIKKDIAIAKESGADKIIVVIHWGNEYQRSPSQEQIDLGDKMIDWGADIILGSHPHVIQESKIINKNNEKKFIVYSMGNFVSNQRRETVDNKYTEDGLIVRIKLEKNIEENKTDIVDIEYIPTWVNRYREGEVLRHQILSTDEYVNTENNELPVEVFNKINESYINTMEIMDKWEKK